MSSGAGSGVGWDVPAAVADACEFHWWHIRPGRVQVLTMLSRVPLWYVGHFDAGRMKACGGPTCECCGRGVGKQLRYVACAMDPCTRQIGVIELSRPVAELLRDWSSRAGGFRGMTIEFSKASKSKHSRMEVRFCDVPPSPFAMSQKPYDLAEVIRLTWGRLG